MRKRIVSVGIFLIIVLSGCAAFTKPVDVVTVERQELLNAYARGKVLYWRAVEIASRACLSGQWPPEECKKASALHEQAKQLASEIDAKIAVPESQIDWQRIMKLFELGLQILL